MDAPPVYLRPLPYEPLLGQRDLFYIDLVVIHCTELPDLETARQFGEEIRYSQSHSGNSGHFYLDRDGRLEQWAAPDRIAHHVRGFNERSLGIELVNLGRYPDWFHSERQNMSEVYPEQQIASLISLLCWLCKILPGLQSMAGHQELDQEFVMASNDPALMVRRKLDPGPLFPWDHISQQVPLRRINSSFITSPRS